MRILFLIDSLVAGGMQRRLLELIKGLKAYPEVELRLITFKEEVHYKEVYELGVPVVILRRVPKQNPMVFYRVFKICRRWQPHIIHSWGNMSAIMAIPSSILLRIKLINGNIVNAPEHMGYFDERRVRAKLTFPFSTAVVGNSWAGLKIYKVPERKRVCIYNGFDTNRVLNLEEDQSIRDRFTIGTPKVVGMVGTFSIKKDFETFIKAGLLVLKQRKDVTFIAVGDGPNLDKCKTLVPPNWHSHFIFTGVQRDVESIVNSIDIGVLATNSETHGEGISNAILEYMALGKPVVATRGGGTHEVVRHDESGFLVDPGNPSGMADRLLFLLDHPEVCKAMGLEGKKDISDKFSLPRMTASYWELYQKHITV
ncbi:MAG: glycosyltransferase [Flavobacteriaceae bacterium]